MEAVDSRNGGDGEEALLWWIAAQKEARISYRLRHKAGGLAMDREQNPE